MARVQARSCCSNTRHAHPRSAALRGRAAILRVSGFGPTSQGPAAWSFLTWSRTSEGFEVAPTARLPAPSEQSLTFDRTRFRRNKSAIRQPGSRGPLRRGRRGEKPFLASVDGPFYFSTSPVRLPPIPSAERPTPASNPTVPINHSHPYIRFSDERQRRPFRRRKTTGSHSPKAEWAFPPVFAWFARAVFRQTLGALWRWPLPA